MKENGIRIIYLLCMFMFLYFNYKICSLYIESSSVIVLVQFVQMIFFLNVYQYVFGIEGYMLPFLTSNLYLFLLYIKN